MTPGQERQWLNNPKSFINDHPEALAKYTFMCDLELALYKVNLRNMIPALQEIV